MNPFDLSGFNPHVQQQLAQLSLDSSSTSSQSSQPVHPSDTQYFHSPRHHNTYVTHIHPRNVARSRQSQPFRQDPPLVPPGLDAFPPLGAEPETYQNVQAQSSEHDLTMSHQSHNKGSAAHEFFSQSRGGYGRGRGRGRGNRGQYPSQSDRDYPYTNQPHNYNQSNNFYRPPPNRPQQSTNYGGQRNFMPKEDQQLWRQRSMLQADFLNFLVTKSVTNSLSHEELKAKHTFRKKLEKIAQDLLVEAVNNPNDLATTELTLESYGSLSNSFGTAGCDVDLILLVQRATQGYIDIPIQFQQHLEKTLLDLGIGAKLLPNTHVPILQVCESPNINLLTNLRARQAKAREIAEEIEQDRENNNGFEGLPVLTIEEEKRAAVAVQQLDDTAAGVPLPEDGVSENAKVEFVGDCGIQCDINFTKRVAIHNTKMLWTYGQCDQRVRPIIVFIKNWAKARDINTPYQGTLSSYGWVILGLHYLMNIVNPPVIPNLQHEARVKSWSEDMLEPFEGYDVAFVKDRASIDEIRSRMPRNKESMGGLLQGFFRYYAHHSGFRWTQDVISIRTHGGLLSKQSKGWTALKRSEDRQNVRHRYLLAIEDPFEIEHNIGRTVGHNGVVAIRDEFRRAWEIIEHVQRGQPGQDTWVWSNRDKTQSGNGIDLISKAETKGDLLRKDQEARREKLAEMRRLAESQEELAKKDNLQSGLEAREGWPRTGMLIDEEYLDNSINLIEDTSQLIHNVQHQDEKMSRMRPRLNSRQNVRCEEDFDLEDDQLDQLPSPMNDQNSAFTASTGNEPEAILANGADIDQVLEVCDMNQLDHSQRHEDGIARQSSSSSATNPNDDISSSPSSNKKVRFAGFEHEEQQESNEFLNTSTKNDLFVELSQSNKAGQQESNEFLVTSNKVGPFIAWSQSSKAGRWLLRRDEQIRAGVFKPDTWGEKGILNVKFRYDPDMTKEELDQKNEILETFYKNQFHPSVPKSEDQHVDHTHNLRISSIDITKVEAASQSSPVYKKSNKEILKGWPVTGDIWWSALTSAGQWLLWRDRKISGGTWVSRPKGGQYVGDKLSELYPYHGEKTFANVERMNAELDTFFNDIEFPRAEMSPEERATCTAAMEEAIEKVWDYRQPNNTQDELLCEEQGDKPLEDKPKSFVGHEIVDRQNINDYIETYKRQTNETSSTLDSQPAWATTTDTGRWLQKRDERIIKGIWRNSLSDILIHVNKIFPFDNTRSQFEQDKLNYELETFCSDFVLPGHYEFSAHDKDLAYEAMLKIVEQRKSRDETRRTDILLDLFKLQGQMEQPPNPHFRNNGLQKDNTNDRELQALQNLSQSLTASPDTADFVRQQRLAFFGQQQKPLGANAENPIEDNADVPSSGSSAVEGVCSLIPPSFCFSSDIQMIDQLANNHQHTGILSTEIPVFCDQHDPVTTDESELVPNTLLPNTWRQDFRKRRDQDPRIMPIPRTLNFMFDPRQITDIETIKAGGNGCARGGLEYTMESDLHSWGGGGAMAQVSNKWSWGNVKGSGSNSWQVGDGGDPLLMRELPDLSDMNT